MILMPDERREAVPHAGTVRQLGLEIEDGLLDSPF